VVFHDLLNQPGAPAYDYWMERAALKLDDSETVDGNIARHVSLLLEENADRKHPFFIAAGFRRPHLLWTAPKKYFDMYDPKQIQLPVEPEGHEKLVPPIAFTRRAPDMTDEHRKMAIQSYYACVSSVDHQVGVLLDEMDKLKLWENTIVLFTSDHGWHLDEHGLWGKVSLFQESAKVPLIIAAPGIKPGVCPRTVEMVDFYPTLTQLAGLTTPANLDGASLVPQLQRPDSLRNRPAFSVLRHGKTWGKAVNTEDWRYTEWGDAANKGAELYDLRSDPKEYHNLAQDPKFADTRAKLKAILDPITGKLRDAEKSGPASD
jgi:iduronate 2-sulfatase